MSSIDRIVSVHRRRAAALVSQYEARKDTFHKTSDAECAFGAKG